jgi:TonB family protein
MNSSTHNCGGKFLKLYRTLGFVLLCFLLVLGALAQDRPADKSRSGSDDVVLPPIMKAPSEMKFPKGARKDHVEGEVSFKGTVLPDGTMDEIAEMAGAPVLVSATREMLETWRFNPATRNGQPIAARLLFTVRYEHNNVQWRQTPIDPANYTQMRIRVSQAVLQAIRIKETPPRSPGVRGTVVMTVIVGTDGRVQGLKILQGNPLINPAAEDAVRQWQYRPYLINGVPVEVESQITINFNPY